MVDKAIPRFFNAATRAQNPFERWSLQVNQVPSSADPNKKSRLELKPELCSTSDFTHSLSLLKYSI